MFLFRNGGRELIKITADSTCDLSKEILEKFDITLIPLYIITQERTFRDGVDISPEDIFDYVESSGKMCTTSAANAYEYKNAFEELLKEYEAVIHINIGSNFSASYENAVLASEELSNVYVIDSANLSTGSGHLVYDAALMAREGMSAKRIVSDVESAKKKIDASFVVDSIDYLYKGGRCSGVEAVGAKVLKIKPCIEISDGKMKVAKKYRGRFESCLEAYVADRLKNRDDIDKSRLFITHTPCSEGVIDTVRDIVKQYCDFEQIIETSAGCTVSNHCGPNTLGILYKRIS